VLEDLPGLLVEGPRTRANVIANMAPAVLRMQEIYREHRARKPGLEGRIELALTAEWTGEIGRLEIFRSTFSDPEFELDVLRPVQFMDFDGWGISKEDTRIVYPIVFGGGS
jgi:hypothetical protein